MKSTLHIVITTIFLSLLFSGCANKGGYTQNSVGQVERLYYAKITAIRNVEIKDDGEGVIWGGIGGALLGSLFGGTTRDQQWATAIGAVAGAAIGANANTDGGQELTLLFEDGKEVITVHRVDKNTPYSFREGDKVRVYMSGGKISRIYLDR